MVTLNILCNIVEGNIMHSAYTVADRELGTSNQLVLIRYKKETNGRDFSIVQILFNLYTNVF